MDDNATNRAILDGMLRGWGMQVVLESDAGSGFNAFMSAWSGGEAFQIVLLDAQMPGHDGFELAADIRSAVGNADAIMMLSSSDIPADVARCRELGIRVHLVKPVAADALKNAVMEFLVKDWHSEAPQPRKSALWRPMPALPKLRILLAEDNLINQKLAVKMLEKQGHQVTVASDGAKAVAALAQREFDLVLMDIQMPVMGGYEATAELRSREAHGGGRTPVIALTAKAMSGDRDDCLARGMDGYVSKPIDWAELNGEIERVLSTGIQRLKSVLSLRDGLGGTVSGGVANAVKR